MEEAAIGGHPTARFNLGVEELDNGRIARAVKHWIIAAKLGHNDALDNVKVAYKKGDVSKEDFATALRAHQSALNETKSPQRQAISLLPRDNKHFKVRLEGLPRGEIIYLIIDYLIEE